MKSFSLGKLLGLRPQGLKEQGTGSAAMVQSLVSQP